MGSLGKLLGYLIFSFLNLLGLKQKIKSQEEEITELAIEKEIANVERFRKENSSQVDLSVMDGGDDIAFDGLRERKKFKAVWSANKTNNK